MDDIFKRRGFESFDAVDFDLQRDGLLANFFVFVAGRTRAADEDFVAGGLAVHFLAQIVNHDAEHVAFVGAGLAADQDVGACFVLKDFSVVAGGSVVFAGVQRDFSLHVVVCLDLGIGDRGHLAVTVAETLDFFVNILIGDIGLLSGHGEAVKRGEFDLGSDFNFDFEDEVA